MVQLVLRRKRHYCLLIALFLAFLPLSLRSQISFSNSQLNSAVLTNPTSLQFGPDGRLYVAQQNGIIKVFTVVKNGPGSYSVTATETITLINSIPNHNDDGNLAPSITTRQVTGILVTGTAAQPVLYVTSSDSRVGGGGPNSDVNLDTNSGILSVLTRSGSTWTKIDLVRGLPRSEENHSVNGMQLDAATNTLLLAVGGITNAGSPSVNFAFTNEYALSAAILSINLNAINSMPTQGSGNTAFKYDLPTVDDPTRSNSGGNDVNDPFGGNDGLNMARIVAGGPVQIFSPGFRNAYDLVITKTAGKAGRIYTIDNGANQGWGGYPANEGPAGNATNNYVSGEPGSTGPGVNEPQVNDLDALHFIGNIATYQPGSYYGGHPDPIRANPSGAGLYTNNGTTGVWRTSTTGANPLPVDWPPVPVAKPVEGDFLMPGGSTSGSLLTFNNSTNGIAEYTASNFNNALKGNLLAVDYGGSMWLIKMTADGTDVTNSRAAGNKLNQDAPLATNFGSIPLDVIAQGDSGPFPGTIWVCMYGSNSVQVFEPQDGVVCTGLDNNQDDDGDGYTNADEIDNGTNPCSAASKPADFDQDNVSDLNDPDDDNDGINDSTDVFPIDANNGTGTLLPVQYPLLNNNPGTGFFGLGFTGLMSNKQASNNYLNNFNPNNLIAGGAAGVLTIVAVSPKDALGTLNNQENAFQFGVNTSSGVPFTVNSRMLGPFFSNQTPSGNQSQGIYIGTGDQSNYLKITLNANGGSGGIQVVTENADAPVTNQYALSGSLSGASTIDLYLSVNPVAGTVQPAYAINGGQKINVGSPIPVSGALLNNIRGTAALAVGIISTSLNASPFTASWDYLNVTADTINTTWVTVAPSNTPKWVGFSVMYNNKMYVFSGFDNAAVHTTPKVEVYDPAVNTWTYLSDMPFPVTHAGITVDGQKVYVAGGFLGGLVGDPNTDKLQIFDIGTNTWSAGPTLPAKMGGNALVRVGRQLHAFGGLLEDRQTGNTAHYVLDLGNLAAGWTNAAAAPLPRCHFASACVAGKIYTFGGQTGHDGPYQDVKYVHVYDPSNDTWTQLTDMPYVRSHSEPATFVMEGKVYLVGGRSGADNNILGNVTSYDPATGSWTEDIPLPTGVTLFGPAAEAIGNEIFVSNGGLNNCCAPQTTTRKRGIARTPNLKIGFLPGTINLPVPSNSTTSKNVLLWTLSGIPSFTINTGALPGWLTVAPTAGAIDLLGGTEIKITANSNGLAAGNYSATVTASAPGYPNATLQVNLTVTQSNVKVLYLYGSIPPGEVDMKLSDAGSTGMSQFATALQQAGFTPTEALDASVTLNATTLNQYKVLILGSNNRRFSAAEKTAVATWVNAGGGLVAWSDAAFGWANGGVNSSDGMLSDNDLTQQFGMQFLHDNGSAVLTLNQWEVDHYLNNFNKNAGLTIKAEGVSPVRTTSPATIVAKIPPCCAVLNPLDGPITAADAALSVAKPGLGRAVCYFDRNTFWNAGDGTRLSEVDNKAFAQKLILWASGVDDSQPSNTAVYRINAGGPQVTNSIGTFAADNFFSPAPGGTFSTTSAIAGTTDDAIYQTERTSTTANGIFSYAFPVSNGTYQVKLHFADIYWTTAGSRKFDVSIEGVKVLDNYDIVQKAGAFTADIENFTTTVTDGTLNINFTAALVEGGVDQPKVSAIEILTTTTTNQPPVANAGPDLAITLPTSTVTLNGSGTDANGTVTGYAWTKVSGSGTIASPSSATTNVTGLTQGTSVFQLVVTDNQGAPSSPDQVIVTVNPAGGTTAVYRINAGGPQVTNSIGTFAADNFFSLGATFSTTSAIAGTTNDAMYQTERTSTTANGTFSYAFPVSNGTYTVVLHFADIYWTTVGSRKFDVSIEGVKVLDNFDIVQKVGALTADIENFTTTVTDGTLNINFTAALAEGGVDQPEVTAIEILTTSTANQPPVANAGPDLAITLPTSTVTLNGSGTDANGTVTGYAWTKVSGSGTIASPTSATTNVTGLTQGTSVFQLVVTDNQGAPSSPDQVVVTVNPTGGTTVLYRINAGGPQVTNSIGTFAADNFFSPGLTFSTASAIAGTTDDAIYQTQRYSGTGNGTFGYAFPVSNGTYQVKLHFAEIYWTTAGSRKFDVSIEGVKVLDNFDVVQKVGAFTADVENFTTTVSNGTLNIDFTAALAEGGVDRPIISAIEILTTSGANQPPVANAGPDIAITLPASTATLNGSGTDANGTVTGYAWTKVSGSGTIASPSNATTNVTGLTQGTSVFQLVVTDNQGAPSSPDQVVVTVNPAGTASSYRINAGGPQVTNSIGTFAADNFFAPAPGVTYSVTSAIAGTTDDAMYQTERYSTTDNGTFSYAFPVINGTYKVVLHFAEIYWTTAGSRKFDVSIEGLKVLDNYDIVQKVGAFTAVIENFTTTVTDGTLNINFTAALAEGGVDRPKVSAIEILPQSQSAAVTPPVVSNPLPRADTAVTTRVFPNPSADGQFRLMTDRRFLADAGYILLSSSGATLKRGKLPPYIPGTAILLDFSREMRAAGLYILYLTDKDQKVVLKLIRK